MSNDNMTPEPSIKHAGSCLLDKWPTSPTKTQLKLISDYQTAWLFPAAVGPFILLVLIGGWGGTFKSGDASAYMVGAVIVCVTESIFQQRDTNFAILKKRWRERRRWLLNDPTVALVIIVIASIIYNTYIAIHDRNVDASSVDWTQIVGFFASLLILPGIRFAATQQENNTAAGQPIEWTDYLRERIESLHSKADEIVQGLHNPSDNHPLPKLHKAGKIFKKIDDPYCAAFIASIEAGMWETAGHPKDAQRARRLSEDLLKQCQR